MSNLLNIGNSGLIASKQALETTSHNISNANTEGYSRQRVQQQAANPILKNGHHIGSGTLIKGIRRFSDPIVEQRLNNAISTNSFNESRSGQLSQIESHFADLDGEGLNLVITKFYNSFRELANQPDNDTIRSVVRDSAQLAVKDINKINENLDFQARSIDRRIEAEVANINIKLKNVAKLNQRIAELEVISDEVGDLRDQRDQTVRELSEYFDVHVYEDDKGGFNLSARGVGTLVSAAEFQELGTAEVNGNDTEAGYEGAVEIFFKRQPSSTITHKFRNGQLASLLKVRNDDIKELVTTVDNIAYEFANTVNAIHRRGFVNRKVSEEAAASGSDKMGKVTNINFFEVPLTRRGAARGLKLGQEVLSDLSNIATSLEPNKVGDNRIAIAVSKLQHEKILDDGNATIEEQYLRAIGKLGIEAGKSRIDLEQSEGIKAQASAIREQISGVSIDEETANLMKYQHAYQASAKVMKVAEEMFQTVLGIKR